MERSELAVHCKLWLSVFIILFLARIVEKPLQVIWHPFSLM
jgi:hypothetical protein